MAKRKKIDQRSVEVLRGDGCYLRAEAEVKKMSGFENCLPLKAALIGDKVEFEFLVGDDLEALKTERFSRQMEAERNL